VSEALGQADIVILSDYQKGILQPTFIRMVLDKAADAHLPVLVDPKGQDFTKYGGATVVCPNLDELSLAVGRSLVQDDRDVESAALSLVKSHHFEAVCVKRSEAGAQLVRNGGNTARHPSRASQVVDVAGAGDTLVATLAMAVASGAELELAACIANAAAGIAVG
jgi:D-beta-D-heptose 7-phosphate kinase/D-beta-D-heptose 1-phosphate adenosyltransferase